MAEKIGILGGTFDPVHTAHMIMAREAYQEYSLDRLFMIPAGRPPHKEGQRGASDEDRLNMVRLAASDSPFIEISEYEMIKKTKSYTVETLRHFRKLYPGSTLYFIMGADSLKDLPDWYLPDEICSLAVILASVRNGLDADEYQNLIDDRKALFNADIRILHTPDIGISSTDIRERIRSGRTIKYLVPEKVEEYIIKKGLYED